MAFMLHRDGVSEGQFYQVLFYELEAIRKACASLEPDYQPPVTFVVVQKRHHTRLFASNHNDNRSTDRSGNILPGKFVNIFVERNLSSLPAVDEYMHNFCNEVSANWNQVRCLLMLLCNLLFQGQLLTPRSATLQNLTSTCAVMLESRFLSSLKSCFMSEQAAHALSFLVVFRWISYAFDVICSQL